MLKPNNFIDMTGKICGRLTVISYAGLCPRRLAGLWNCQCECGKSVQIIGKTLRNGKTRSCGCLIGDTTALRNARHGSSKTPEYMAYYHMKNRCLNSNDKSYQDYGGRGISVCERWLFSFENFLSDMGRRPTSKHSLERLDVNKNYCPENCKWGTQLEQGNNKRNNHRVFYLGKHLTLSQWSKELGLKYNTIRDRAGYGWSAEKIFTFPVKSV